MSVTRSKLLIFTDWYIPAFKAGGPVQSCKNLVNLLKNEFSISIITSDRDLGDQESFKNLSLNQWVQLDKNVQIIYLTPENTSIKQFHQLIEEVQPESIYLNSMFSPSFTIKPIFAYNQLKVKPKLILAPRGMLRKGALQYKIWKKLPFLKILKWMKVSKNIYFHATDEQEVKDIQQHFPNRKIHLIGNVPNYSEHLSNPPKPKEAGVLELVFISRVSSIKNIDLLLEWLNKYSLKGKWRLSIYGEPESESFGLACKKLSDPLPVIFKGGIPTHEVSTALSQCHVFILPSRGENFGHAIFEALNAGLPVIISDQTPWLELKQKRAGFDLSLNHPTEFIEAIQYFIDMNNEEYRQWSLGARQLATNYISGAGYQEKYFQLFSTDSQ